MGKLKMKYEEKTFKVVDFHELERVIKEYFGITHNNYNIVAINEWNNGTYIRTSAKKHDNFSFDIEAIAETKELCRLSPTTTIPKIHVHAIMNAMCDDGFIEEGDYLIEVSW